MKKKSGHRRRTKVVRRSRKNLRRTVKRKSLAKGRRRPTRRYSRVQRGGLIPEDFKKLKDDANEGHADAQYRLGEIYANGKGISTNYINALKWYKSAADKEHAIAQYKLGIMSEKGLGVAKDDTEAARWYQLAAAQGYAPAQYNLGYMYENGLGVAQNDAEAAQWYQLAAAQEHAAAEFNLGKMYEEGRGVTQNYAKAVRLWRLAAKKIHPDAAAATAALQRLGVRVEEGPRYFVTHNGWKGIGQNK